MQNPATAFRRSERANGGSVVTAVFGAAATVVLLTGIVAIAASPRSLSDDARLPLSAESFEVTPFFAPEVPSEDFAVAPVSDQPVELGLWATDAFPG